MPYFLYRDIITTLLFCVSADVKSWPKPRPRHGTGGRAVLVLLSLVMVLVFIFVFLFTSLAVSIYVALFSNIISFFVTSASNRTNNMNVSVTEFRCRRRFRSRTKIWLRSFVRVCLWRPRISHSSSSLTHSINSQTKTSPRISNGCPSRILSRQTYISSSLLCPDSVSTCSKRFFPQKTCSRQCRFTYLKYLNFTMVARVG